MFLRRALPGLGMLLALASLALASGGLAPAKPEPSPASLVQGKPVEGRLGPGQADAYVVPGGPGDFLHVRLLELDGDFELTLRDASGKTLRRTDAFQWEWEEIAVVASGPPPYLLEVRSSDTAGPTTPYRLELLTSRAPSGQDARWIRGTELAGEITDLYNSGKKEDLESAIDKCREIIRIWHELGELSYEVLHRTLEARISADLGENEKAIKSLEELLPVARKTEDPARQYVVENELARCLGRTGEHQKAIEHYREALRLNALSTAARARATILNNEGLLYYRLGKFHEGLADLEEALTLARKYGEKRRECEILNNIGLIRLELGESETALEIFSRIPPIRRELKDREGEANAVYNLGVAYRKTGNNQKARELYEQALPIVREVGSRYGEGYVLTSLGEVCDELGERDRAISYFEAALAIRRAVADLEGEGVTLRSLATAQRHLGHFADARVSIEAAISRYELVRGNVASPGRRASFFRKARPAYDEAIVLLMEMHAREPEKGFAAAALEASERARARSLVEMLSEFDVDLRRGVDPALLARETALRKDLRENVERQLRLAASQPGTPEAAAAVRDVDTAQRELEETDAEIRVRSPRFSALTSDRPLPTSELQAMIGPDTVLLEYALTRERGFVWAVTSRDISSASLPPSEEVEKAARRFYGALSGSSQFPKGETGDARRLRLSQSRREAAEAGETLSKMLLAPVASSLRGKRLAVVAEGALQYVPFAALPSPKSGSGKMLAAQFEITTLPSASLLAVLRRERTGRARATGTLAVLADPVFDSADARVRRSVESPAPPDETAETTSPAKPAAATRSDGDSGDPFLRSAGEAGFEGGRIPRLPFSRREAEAILALAPPKSSRRALDFDASLANATDPSLGHYRMIHFATHGLINTAHPELSGIVLSLVDEKGHPRPGFLTSSQIYGLELPVDVVVLSGCQTALGQQLRGEGLIGLTSGFLHAGARAVVASLWKVDDEATAELMTAFYRGMLVRHLAPAAALTAAQRELARSRRWSDPFYWAGFVYQGDWAEPAASAKP